MASTISKRRQPKQEWSDDFTQANSLGGHSEPSLANVRVTCLPPNDIRGEFARNHFQNNVERDEFLENMDKEYDNSRKLKANPTKSRNSSLKNNAQTDSGGYLEAMKVATHNRNPPANEGGWNNDTSITYDDDRSVRSSTKLSPVRNSPISSKSVNGGALPSDVEQARNGLSLLKKRITKATRQVSRPDSQNEENARVPRAISAPMTKPANSLYESGGVVETSVNSNVYRTSSTASANHHTPRKDREPAMNESSSKTSVSAAAPLKEKRVGVSKVAPGSSSGSGVVRRVTPANREQVDDMDTPPKSRVNASSARTVADSKKNVKFDEEPAIPTAAPSNAAAVYEQPLPDEYAEVGPMCECPDCGRKFNEKAYEKHAKICKKVFVDKRKAFDMTAQRIDNPEQLQIMKKAVQEEKRKARQVAIQQQKQPNGAIAGGEGKAKWRAEHEQFMAILKQNKLMKKAEAEGGPMPEFVPSAPDPSLIQCPHCGRRFNEKAAERHIPQCTNIKAKPTSLKRGAGSSASSNAANAAVNRLGSGIPPVLSRPAPVSSKPVTTKAPVKKMK